MWNLIKMDFYRLFTSKTIKVGAIMACLICAGYMLMSLGIVELIKLTVGSAPLGGTGMEIFLPVIAWITGTNFSVIVFSGTSAFSLFIGCMICASFIGSEQSCGYTKNFAGQLPNKGYMAISKFVVTALAQVMIFAIYVIVSSLLAVVLFGSSYITSYDIIALLPALALRLMLYLAIDAIIIFICTLTKSHAVAMVIGCIFGFGVTKFVYLIAGMILGMLKINIPIADYMPDGIDSQLTVNSADSLAVKAIVVSLIFTVVFVAANYFVLRKRDVK